MKSVLILASQNRLLPIFSTPPARNDREAIPPELSSSDSKFRTGKFLFFSVLKYRILVKCTTFTAIHGPSHSGRSPKNTPVKRVNTYVKCMCQQGLQFSFDIFIRNTFFSLQSQAPILTTLITGIGTVPTRSRTLNRIISQTGLSIFAFHRVTLDYDTRFFLRKGSHLGKIVRYYLKPELDYKTSQVTF